MELSGDKTRRQPKRMVMCKVRVGMWGVDVTEKMQVTENGNGWFPVATSNGNMERKQKLYFSFQFMTSV